MNQENNIEEKVKILIVEDERIIAEDLKISLENENYEVIGIIDSGEKAIEYVKENELPSIIMMDINLNGKLNGIETVNIINKKYENIICIYCSSYCDIETLDKAKLSSARGYLTKPIWDDELKKVIKLVLINDTEKYYP